jgi:hypothetical protein
MSANWRVGFKKALIDVLTCHGYKLKDDGYYRTYGWEDYQGTEDMKKAMLTIGINYEATTWQESTWEEFMGTFYEGDTRVKGVDLRVVLKDKTEFDWRWSGSVSDLIQQVIAEAGK